MPFKTVITKTDRRYSGWRTFKYVVTFKKIPWSIQTNTDRLERFELFRSVSEWCTQTWGSSVEKSLYLEFIGRTSINDHWSWATDEYNLRIYLVDQKDRDWFSLRWL